MSVISRRTRFCLWTDCRGRSSVSSSVAEFTVRNTVGNRKCHVQKVRFRSCEFGWSSAVIEEIRKLSFELLPSSGEHLLRHIRRLILSDINGLGMSTSANYFQKNNDVMTTWPPLSLRHSARESLSNRRRSRQGLYFRFSVQLSSSSTFCPPSNGRLRTIGWSRWWCSTSMSADDIKDRLPTSTGVVDENGVRRPCRRCRWSLQSSSVDVPTADVVAGHRRRSFPPRRSCSYRRRRWRRLSDDSDSTAATGLYRSVSTESRRRCGRRDGLVSGGTVSIAGCPR